MEDNIEELAALETLDNGKPYHFSRDVGKKILNLK